MIEPRSSRTRRLTNQTKILKGMRLPTKKKLSRQEAKLR